MAKKTTTVQRDDVLAPAEQKFDLDFVQSVGAGLIAWLKRAAEFITTANKYETRALQLLSEAQKLKLPKNGDEDAALQHTIQRYNQGKKTIEEHWNGNAAAPGPAALLHRLHRRATAKRDVGINALTEASAIGNRLHVDYTAAERRRAEEERRREQERIDREAQEQRDRELAELEIIALRKEAESPDLSERERRFVDEYLRTDNAIRAAQFAGYKDAAKQAQRLMMTVKIEKAIQALKDAAAIRAQQRAVRAEPLITEQVEVKPDVRKAAGATERTTRSAEITDPEAFIAAVFDGKLGIPRDVLMIDLVKMNQYARDLEPIVNRWPGVRVKRDTKVV
jgi:hypothetical protein